MPLLGIGLGEDEGDLRDVPHEIHILLPVIVQPESVLVARVRRLAGSSGRPPA